MLLIWFIYIFLLLIFVAHNRPKSQFLFHKDLQPRDFSLMTLVLIKRESNFDESSGQPNWSELHS